MGYITHSVTQVQRKLTEKKIKSILRNKVVEDKHKTVSSGYEKSR